MYEKMVKFSISSGLIEDFQQLPASKTVDEAADLAVELTLQPIKNSQLAVCAIGFTCPTTNILDLVRLPLM